MDEEKKCRLYQALQSKAGLISLNVLLLLLLLLRKCTSVKSEKGFRLLILIKELDRNYRSIRFTLRCAAVGIVFLACMNV